MLGWPGGPWGDQAEDLPPVAADWRALGAEVRHTFTHFHLRLSVRVARLEDDATPERGAFHTRLRRSDLPTVMRKAFDLARPELDRE